MRIYEKNSLDIADINRNFLEKTLYADPAYQRRKVWNDQDKVRLIETILMEYVIPEVFFWVADRDPETGKAITHIVDGQQRISTIVDYLADQFPLTKRYLLDKRIQEECGDKYFSQLDPKYKEIIWGYQLSVVNISRDCSIDDIKTMFYRLNLTNYNLNSQEKRHSKDSAFGEKCMQLSTDDFWDRVRVFSSTDSKRMLDVVYCGTIYILANEFIVNQTDGRKLNQYYDTYATEFDEDGKLKEKIYAAMGCIDCVLNKVTISFLSKKAQLYTVFSVLFGMMDEEKEIGDLFFWRFTRFVKLYSMFRNGYTLGVTEGDMQRVFSMIERYKLASSEGVNKINNRVIRFRTLYEYCTDASSTIDDATNMVMEAFGVLYNKAVDDSFENDDIVTQ